MLDRISCYLIGMLVPGGYASGCGGRLPRLFYKMFVCISESNSQILFFVNKIMHLLMNLNLLKTFSIQTYMLAVFNGETSKGILFSKLN